jgi:hypothetical protein
LVCLGWGSSDGVGGPGRMAQEIAAELLRPQLEETNDRFVEFARR